MPTFKRIEDIEAWQLARSLFREILQICEETGLAKDFKLRDQIKASSGSVMDNIAEGFGRGGNKEFVQFLEVSHASCTETQSQLYRVLDNRFIDQERFDHIYNIAKRTDGAVLGLIRYLQSSDFRGPRF
ncbi:four helix bundle protein [Flaviaesturariibacter flavus]|uniref:Four helix bundle protein n=1 Tax=Flaviaesturariibacter flavus TaxID=2502780 RepID=A0A4R1BMS6_9BACT|nr:four helix bundle protein [Flaviaesturariibacter flavus]TCJ18801.1 four helix bundle protein [Flaviaesturariibacter flavus]